MCTIIRFGGININKIIFLVFAALLLPLSVSYGNEQNHSDVKNRHHFNLLAPQQVVGNWQASKVNANSEITMHTFKVYKMSTDSKLLIVAASAVTAVTGAVLLAYGASSLLELSPHTPYHDGIPLEDIPNIRENSIENIIASARTTARKLKLGIYLVIAGGIVTMSTLAVAAIFTPGPDSSDDNNKNLDQISTVVFKNPLGSDMYYDAEHSHCSNGNIAQGFDILAGKNNAQGVPQAIAEQAYSIGALIYADKKRKAAHCTLAYSTNEQVGGKAYHRTLKLKVDQIAMGSNGQLQATVIPAGGINGKSLYIQPPKAVSELQKAELAAKSLAKPAIPFVKRQNKQADNSQNDAADKAKPGVAIVGLSSGDNSNSIGLN